MDYNIEEEYCKIIQSKLDLEDFDGALLNAKKLLKYAPDCARGYYYQGLCHYALCDFDASINNYEKCIELDHNFAKAYYNLGIAKYYLGYFKEAKNYIEYAYKLFTNKEDKTACAKCVDSLEFIQEEQDRKSVV